MLRGIRLVVGAAFVFVCTSIWAIAFMRTVAFDSLFVGIGIGLAAGLALAYVSREE